MWPKMATVTKFQKGQILAETLLLPAFIHLSSWSRRHVISPCRLILHAVDTRQTTSRWIFSTSLFLP